MNQLRALRIPLFLLGLALVFIAERYLKTYDSYKIVLIIGAVVTILPIALSFLLMQKVKAQGLLAEAKSWRLVLIWKLLVVLAVALYFIYKWTLDTTLNPESLGQKALLVLWLSTLFLGLFMGLGVEFSHRMNGTGENAEPNRLAYSSKIWLSIGFLFLGLGALNYGAAKKDKVYDLSYFKSTKPGEATLNTVASLSAPVRTGVFFAKDSEVAAFVKEYLDVLAAKNNNLQLEFYDKDFYPAQAEEFKVSKNGQIVLLKDGKRQRIDLGDKLENARKKLKTLDAQFQKALLQLTSEQGSIYFTSSHGEMGWGIDRHSPLRSLRNLETVLRSQNLTPKTLASTFAPIPDDAAAVAVVGPTASFTKEEVQTLRDYLNRGGKLLLALDVESSGEQTEEVVVADQNEMQALLTEIGIQFRKDRLANDKEFVRSTRQKFDRVYLYTNLFGSHESVSTLTRNDEKLNILALHAGHLVVEGGANNWNPVATIMTLRSTFIDTNKNFEYEPTEVRGSYPLAAAAEKDMAEGKKGRIIVLADASMLSDPPLYYNGNQWMALDAFRWLTDRMNTAGAVESEEDVRIQHSKGRELVLFHGSIYLAPLLILTLGFVANRRKRGRA
ncbi:MAG: Gldg family protein [Pseudobdellovibrionaceae bacterium]|nr:Gldg family protein [Pseudobdellovibrionaceae bacterium]